MSPPQLQQKLTEIDPEASSIGNLKGTGVDSARFLSFEWLGAQDPPWKHTAHAFGYIGATPELHEAYSPIQHIGQIRADKRLRKASLRITLDGLRVAGYPGSGDHRVLFDFYAQNYTRGGVEHAHFNATYRVRDGERAAVLNFPLFLGLRVGSAGLVLRCFTVNVKNDEDEERIAFLESDVFRAGLRLAAVAQPALVPLSSLAVGFTKMIAERHRNVAVQDIILAWISEVLEPVDALRRVRT